MNTFGNIYRLTTFGESHGPAIGGVIDGIPSRQVISLAEVQRQLDRRRPGQSALTTSRREADRLKILSGVMAYDALTGELSALTDDADVVMTLGTPIGFMVANADAHSGDYDNLKHTFRPSHADFAWQQRYGVRDWRGGGRSSGRETISRVVAGAFARQLLESRGVAISANIVAIGSVQNPDEEQVVRQIMAARNEADSVGGIVECKVAGFPAGIGEPVFDKLQAMLAHAVMSIGAVKGIEFGMGFSGVCARGSDVVDEFVAVDGKPHTLTNNSGGIQGGISNGEEITMRVAVKPTPTIARNLRTINDQGEETTIFATGRHDPSIVHRIIPVIESMTAMTLLDAWLMRAASNF